jgi:hypothetical protein
VCGIKTSQREKKSAFYASAAVDVFDSVPKIAISLPEGAGIAEEILPGDRIDGDELLDWIVSSIEKHGLSLDDVLRWTIGTGPAAFSAVRILSATILGISFGKTAVKIRGLPSATAFLGLFPNSLSEFSVIYQAMPNNAVMALVSRNGLFCEVRRFVFAKSVYELVSMVEKPANTLIFRGKCGRDSCFEVSDDFKLASEYPVKELLFLNPGFWERGSAKRLIYAREAAVEQKKQS